MRTLTATVTVLAAASALAAQSADVGSKVSYQFREAPMNAQGVRSLADLQGKPTIIEFWGINCPPCVGSAVPSAVKMATEMPDAINTIFVESQNHSMDEVRKLALSRKWFGTNALWTTERPCSSPGSGLPAFVLLSPEGEVVLSGNPITMHKEIEEYVHEQASARAAVPDDLPKKLKKAWKELQKGDFEDALDEVSDHLQSNDAELATAAKAFDAKVRDMARAAVTQLERAVDEGHYVTTLDRAKDLVDNLGDQQAIDAANALITRLESDELEAELKADKAWTKVETMLFTKGTNERIAVQVQRFVDKFSGTKAADRAEMYARAMGE